ncbi:MAG: hypothetical protein ACKPBB_18440, partial [Sphaerospermopsis kisseleviana]
VQDGNFEIVYNHLKTIIKKHPEKSSTSSQKIIKKHPENPQILDILIQTIKILKSSQTIIKKHPENPQILDILIQTNND